MEKIICYIDRYNLYHATQDHPSARVNLYSLAQSLLEPSFERIGEKVLQEVHYFSAYATWRPEDEKKHRAYVSELKRAGVKVTMSHFKKSAVTCQKCGTKWWQHEEKETDVKLCLQLLEDAADNKFDTAFVLTGDSDMVPAIESIKRRYPEKKVLAAIPQHRVKMSRDIKRVVHGLVNLSPSRIKKHLF